MVSTTFVRETELEINLPEASGEVQDVAAASIEIVVDKSGDYAVNDRVLVNTDKRTLVRALRETMASMEQPATVVITADAQATHQSVVRAMDAAGTVGLSQLSITTRQPAEED